MMLVLAGVMLKLQAKVHAKRTLSPQAITD